MALAGLVIRVHKITRGFVMEKDDVGLFQKVFFGKISRKLIFAFLVMILILIFSGALAIVGSQNALIESIGENSVVIAQDTIDEIDRVVFFRKEEAMFFSSDERFKKALVKSNKEFDAKSNTEKYIAGEDANWVSVPKEVITPFMSELIDSDLSERLRDKINFFEEQYGYQVIGEIFLTNKFGANIAQSGKTSDYYQADEMWWQQAEKNGTFVSDVEYDDSVGIYSIEISTSIFEKEEFLGVMKFVVNINDLIKVIDSLSNDESVAHGHGDHSSMEIKLINSQGKLIHSTEKAGFEIFEDVSEKLQKRFETTGHIHYFVDDGDKAGEGERLFAHAHSRGFKDFAGLGWTVVIEHETFEIFEPVINLRNQLIFFIILSIVLAILFSFFISRRISKPINALSKATRELEKGNFKARAEISTIDEFEDLGNSFNKTVKVLEEMDKKRQQLEHAKTEFLSITSHELRSPMTPMRAQLQMILGEYFGEVNPKQRESLDIVLRNTERLDRIIQDFLEISRIEAARLKFKFIKTSLNKPIESLLKEMEGFMPEKKIKLVPHIDNLPIIEVDSDRVMQVLRNLINNAKKFSPERAEIAVTAKQKKGIIEFSVSDQGVGLSKDDKRRVFEPFYQADQTMYNKQKGTGLGLAICRGIVESQNGKIWIESEKKKGSIFYFTIPLEPVRESKSIKLLFSSSEEIEKKVGDLFVDILGPMGANEFAEIKDKGVDFDSITDYFKEITKIGIITAANLVKASNQLEIIFETRSIKNVDLPKQIEMLYLEYLGSDGDERFGRLEKLTANVIFSDIIALERLGKLNSKQASLFRDKVMGLFRRKAISGKNN